VIALLEPTFFNYLLSLLIDGRDKLSTGVDNSFSCWIGSIFLAGFVIGLERESKGKTCRY
jgi:hypothetical protein